VNADPSSILRTRNKNKLLLLPSIVVVVVLVTFIVATKQPTTMENSTPLEDDSSLNVIVIQPNESHATALSLVSEFDTDVPRQLLFPQNNNSIDPNARSIAPTVDETDDTLKTTTLSTPMLVPSQLLLMKLTIHSTIRS
jgi:hypothetical protein